MASYTGARAVKGFRGAEAPRGCEHPATRGWQARFAHTRVSFGGGRVSRESRTTFKSQYLDRWYGSYWIAMMAAWSLDALLVVLALIRMVGKDNMSRFRSARSSRRQAGENRPYPNEMSGSTLSENNRAIVLQKVLLPIERLC
jgi:hypothetical protein